MDAFDRELSLFQGNFDDKVSFFHDLFYKYYNKCCPIRSKMLSLQRFSEPWLTDALLQSINHKHFLYRQYKLGYVEFEVYNLYKNRVTNLLRNAKSQHLNLNLTPVKVILKKTWMTINRVLNFTSAK